MTHGSKRLQQVKKMLTVKGKINKLDYTTVKDFCSSKEVTEWKISHV